MILWMFRKVDGLEYGHKWREIKEEVRKYNFACSNMKWNVINFGLVVNIVLKFIGFVLYELKNINDVPSRSVQILYLWVIINICFAVLFAIWISFHGLLLLGVINMDDNLKGKIMNVMYHNSVIGVCQHLWNSESDLWIFRSLLR